MSKIITVEELRNLEGWKKDGLGFPHPSDILPDFLKAIDKLGEHQLLITVDKEGGVITQDNQDIKSYGRGVITATFTDYTECDVAVPVIGLIWAYDITKPYIKMFVGMSASACTNLCIFGADNIATKYLLKPKIKDESELKRKWNRVCRDATEDIIYRIQDEVENIKETIQSYIDTINTLKSAFVIGNEIYELIGNIYINDVLCGKLDYNNWSEGCKIIFDPAYLHPNKILYTCDKYKDTDIDMAETPYGADELVLTLWKLYGALTQRITDGLVEINDIPDKTLQISKTLLKYV